MQLFNKGDFYKAKLEFTIIVLNNPGHRIIEEAQFYLAESHFNLKEYILAIEEYDKLIRSMPRSEFVDDARYKIGMSYYKLAPGYALDQEYTYKAVTQFQLFLEEYPDSDLRSTVEDMLETCRNKLAKKEYKTGELYRKMSLFESAIISFDVVLEQFYDTEYADDALYWKGECHRHMGEWDEAEQTFNDLITNHTQSALVSKAMNKLETVKEKKAEEASNSTGDPVN